MNYEEEIELYKKLKSYFKIREIDDEAFRKAVFNAITRKDKERRFEIHNTDLIYCLRASFLHKILPQEFSEDEYSMILHWLRGKGIEIGIINTLRGLLSDKILQQKEVTLGKSVGTLDLEMFGIPYEITTRLFYGSTKNWRKYPPIDKVLQEISYQIATGKKVGRVKVYIMVPPSEYIDSQVGELKTKKKIRRAERTWEIHLTRKGFRYFKKLFIERAKLLEEALETGNWKILPKAFFNWRCEGCDGCDLLENHPDEIKKAWIRWKIERERRKHVS